MEIVNWLNTIANIVIKVVVGYYWKVNEIYDKRELKNEMPKIITCLSVYLGVM